MAFTFEAVMEGVATRLRTISGLRVSFYTPDQINPPHAAVGMPEVVDYHTAMGRGLAELSLGVQVFVTSVDDRTGQLALAAYGNPAGGSSVVRAVEADRRLGGAVSDCIVTTFRPFGRQDVGGVPMYVGEFSLRIYASGI
jgi:hypothetical protein